MRKAITLLLSTFLFALSLYLTAFQSKDLLPSQVVKNQYIKNLETTQIAVNLLVAKALALDKNTNSTKALQIALIDARTTFKKAEFLASYLDYPYVFDYINGPPLPKLEKKVPMPTKIDPKGLQVLDELIFSDDVFDAKNEILELSKALQSDLARFIISQKQIDISDRMIFESVRESLTTVFTLSLTGFDTPASGNALKESESVISSLANALKPYKAFINQNQSGLGDQIDIAFSNAINYISKNQDFDSFDRLNFYRKHLGPLNKMILEAHKVTGIETIYEVSNFPQSVNYMSIGLFEADYLNPYFYTQLREEEDNSKVFELGKLLFYDPILSDKNERSCASCHKPQLAFTDGQKKSIARDFMGTVSRNAPTLLNVVYSDRYFHDMRTDVLEQQVDHVVTSSDEFHTSFLALEKKLKRSSEYQEKFKEAFPKTGTYVVSNYTISAALASYVKSLNAFNSEFDRYARSETNEINPAVERGFNLFMGKAACGTCHFAPIFNGTVPPRYRESESEVLGTPASKNPDSLFLDTDVGRYGGMAKEKIDFYKYSFKTPTVRNISLTAPYMHNGVYSTLEEVMDFYIKGGGEGLGYEVPHQTLPFDKLNLTDQESKDIIAFMNALTDTVGTTSVPDALPTFENDPDWNNRKIGGVY
jgi:cytochrome c peroxidase